MNPPIIVVTGMPFEARIARGDGVLVVCAQNSTLAADLEAAIARDGARGLVSFGTAGGLIPGVKPGQWVIAHKVLDMPQHAREYVAAIGWAEALRRAMPGALRADLAGVTAPVVSADDKAALFRESGAAAADMESHIVARVAQAHGLPFVAARVVIDPAERSLPPAALAGLRSDGSTDILGVLRSLAVNPRQLPALLRVGKDASLARQAMRHGRQIVALKLGDGFGAVAAGI
ncbi:phosphorylase [Pandoraea fibrosis]|uniref:5'-methylthioadenosine/S-adenosylhomocysteine nucleosidase n=1 Tax=Pandoraea fibrosis TaxID=1891094 RepID=A0A5E4VPT5_9BURK|nr:phosphorylase [Pandoraea fibrosis]QHE91671.1 phosphorylase [Pandoraea fibrosis]QHF14771.1 phosphorylase [Pandoraea fibrosis]VVE13070.1 5'-methylthioadenosine/S-adenosylhomocysteine nucleosidase [Pandoraea fibrosis]